MEELDFAAWETYSADTTSNFVRFNENFATENRTIGTYCSSISDSICTGVNSFSVAARTIQKGTRVGAPKNSDIYNPRLTAKEVNDWARSGLLPSLPPQYDILTPGGQDSTGVGDAQCPMNPNGPGRGCTSNSTKDEYTDCLQSKTELSKKISCLTGLAANEAGSFCVNDCADGQDDDFDDCRSDCVTEERAACFQPCYEERTERCASSGALDPPWKYNDLFAESNDPTIVNGDTCAQDLATCIFRASYNITSDEERECKDSLLDIKIGKKKKFVSCKWASKKTKKRSKIKEVKSHCPITCDTTKFCEKDSTAKKIILKENGAKKSCKWVKKKVEKRCGLNEICDTCRAACET
jgi:hypothetical protein